VLTALIFHAAVNTSLNFLPVDAAFPTWVVLLGVIATAAAVTDRGSSKSP
jgi:hypothetical protein